MSKMNSKSLRDANSGLGGGEEGETATTTPRLKKMKSTISYILTILSLLSLLSLFMTYTAHMQDLSSEVSIPTIAHLADLTTVHLNDTTTTVKLNELIIPDNRTTGEILRSMKPTYTLSNPPTTPEEIKISKEKIIVAVMTSHFFGPRYDMAVDSPPCPFDCTFQRKSGKNKNLESTADALWYHSPAAGAPPSTKPHPAQIRVIMSMESAKYYPKLSSKEFMSKFDIEMTYRTTSDIPLYYAGVYVDHYDEVFAPIKIPYEEKIKAVIYMQSNCKAKSGRHDIVQAQVDADIVSTHSVGACAKTIRNSDTSKSKLLSTKRVPDKLGLLGQYMFCIAIENSIDLDYITEKLWEAFSAGCIPIYYGSPNIKDILPHPKSVIVYDDYLNQTDAATAMGNQLKQIMESPDLYDEMVSWRGKPLHELSEGFQNYVKKVAVNGDTRCRVCGKALEAKLRVFRSKNTISSV